MGISSLLAALLVFTGALASGSSGAVPSAKLDPTLLTAPSPRAIVGFDHDVDAGTMERLAQIGVTRVARFDLIDAIGIIGPREVYDRIARWSDVTYVDHDSPLRFDNYAAKKETRVSIVRTGHAPLRRRYDGKGVTVAVIDSGIDDHHPDLAGKVIQHMNFEPAWIFEQIEDGAQTDSLAQTTASNIDTLGHGTHVAGTIAGTGVAGKSQDYSGAAPGASLVNLKVAEFHQAVRNIGWESNALTAYEWAIEHRNDRRFPGGIRIINNSWHIDEADSNAEPITSMVEVAYRAGIINIFSAGNQGPGPNTVNVGPTRLRQVITVAASCRSVNSCGAGKIAQYSSRGPQVDVTAPGWDIFSTVSLSSAYIRIGGYETPTTAQDLLYYVGSSGTSMSTPHVSGIVALMLQANPKLSRYRVQQLLYSTARDRGAPGFDNTWGHGLVDAFAAVRAAETYRPR